MALFSNTDLAAIAFPNDNAFDVTQIDDTLIKDAELQNIRPVFKYLYDKIVANNNTAATPLETEFLNQIKTPLALYVKALLLPEIHVQATNAGAVQMHGEYFKQASDKSRDAVISNLNKRANVRIQRVVEWYGEQVEFTSKDNDNDKSDNTPSGDIIL